jgi:hypothetical protein
MPYPVSTDAALINTSEIARLDRIMTGETLNLARNPMDRIVCEHCYNVYRSSTDIPMFVILKRSEGSVSGEPFGRQILRFAPG